MNKWFYALVPALVTFGPLVMTIAQPGQDGPLGLRLAGLLSALGLGLGLALMFRALRAQQAEIDALQAKLEQLASAG